MKKLGEVDEGNQNNFRCSRVEAENVRDVII